MLQQVVIALLVVVLMFSIGVRTDLAAFRSALRRPLALGLALIANVAVVPLLALGVASLTSLPPAVLAGFVICASCPGGPAGPLFASRAGGDLAVAASATIGLSVASVLTAPPTLSRVLGLTVDLDLGAVVLPMIGTLAVFQLVPLGLGMLLRRLRPEASARWARPTETLANLLLFSVVFGLLLTKWRVLGEVGGYGLAVAAAMVLGSLVVGALTSTEPQVRRSLCLVTGVRNISLALLVSATWMPDPQVDAAILGYGLCTMVLPFAAARLWPR